MADVIDGSHDSTAYDGYDLGVGIGIAEGHALARAPGHPARLRPGEPGICWAYAEARAKRLGAGPVAESAMTDAIEILLDDGDDA